MYMQHYKRISQCFLAKLMPNSISKTEVLKFSYISSIFTSSQIIPSCALNFAVCINHAIKLLKIVI